MNVGKRVLVRVASDLADGTATDRFALVTLWRRLRLELKGTRSDALDRAYLATNRGRLNMPPYASLRQ